MSILNQIPLAARVIVKMDLANDQKEDVKFIQGKEKIVQGEIIKAGDGCKYVKPGDRVVVDNSDGIREEVDGRTYIAIQEKQLSAIIQ